MSAQRLRAGVTRLLHEKLSAAVRLLLALAVVIVAALAFNLANLDPGGESIPQTSTPAQPASRVGVFFPDPIATTILTILFAFFLVGSVILLVRSRRSTDHPVKAFTWWQVLARALGMALLVAVLVGWPRAIQAARERAGTEGNTTTADAGTLTTVWPAATGWPVELFLIVAVLAAVVWLVYLLRRGGRPEPEWDAAFPVPAARPAAVFRVQATIHDLEAGGDVRATILVCLERFCALLGARGFSDQGDPH